MTPPPFPPPDSEEWGALNRRRAELLRKRAAGTLPPDEAAECERLQRLSQEALEQSFPAPDTLNERLERLERGE